LFDFLHWELGLSRGSAHYRKVAAQLVQQFPEVVEPLRSGRLCISAVLELAKVITRENTAVVLPKFFRLSKQKAKAVAVEIQPAEVVPRKEMVAALPLVSGAPAGGVQPVELGRTVELPANALPKGTSLPVFAQPDRGASVEPRTSDLRRLHMTVTKQFLDKLESARKGQGHAQPGASAEKVLEAGLDLLLVQQAKRRAEARRPQQNPRPARNPGHVPAAVKRAVWARESASSLSIPARAAVPRSASRSTTSGRSPVAASRPSPTAGWLADSTTSSPRATSTATTGWTYSPRATR
jgi:hypothetical protein